jgi:peptidylprolyl isomerase
LEGISVRRLALVLVSVCVAFAGVAAVAGSASAASASAASSLAKVKVAGAVGAAPKVTFAAPFTVAKTVHVVSTAGTGAALTQGQVVTFDYLLLDGRTGKKLESSFGKTPQSLSLDTTKTVPTLVNGLIGVPIGSRVVIAIAPKDGLAKSLKTSKVKKNDTLVFVFDVRSAVTPAPPLTRAAGEPVAPVAGLPTVTLDATGKPTITVPATAAPSTLVVQPLIKGTGPVVTAGQTVTVHYTGVIWATGKQFDSSWDRGATADFQIGIGKVISGWDTGLVGQTVGSQVLLVVPPAQGYGSAGSSAAGIKGTDTLVFVVDILAAS